MRESHSRGRLLCEATFRSHLALTRFLVEGLLWAVHLFTRGPRAHTGLLPAPHK